MKRLLVILAALAITASILALSLSSSPSRRPAHSALTRRAPGGPATIAPRPGWLGLNGNTVDYLGPIDTFSRAGVVFDRDIDLQAGSLPAGATGTPGGEARRVLAEDHALGMSPVAVIEYGGYGRPGTEFQPDPQFPHNRSPAEAARGSGTIAAYVAGFLRTAGAILQLTATRYPGTEVRFEVMNEPWGNTSPQYGAAEYAEVVAALLPAAVEAGIPARDIYVAATGESCSAAGCRANDWVAQMYRTEPSLRQEVQGWYLHPYGPAGGLTPYANGGIEAVPLIRASMASGRDNLIVSEIGFCASDVNNPAGAEAGVACHGAQALSSAQAATSLVKVLERARAYHRQGWLGALIVYSRNDGGWAMQLPGGALTPSGRALLSFAKGEPAG